jgi:predicted lysophospholipase L1 biosynthesis ABC-type transport system permease subunit
MGIPVRGRAPDWTDTYRAAGEVVVSQALAERLWPGEDALGKEVRGGMPGGEYYRVVGVAGDVRQDGLDKPPAEAVYYPLLPRTGESLWMPPVSGSFVVRTGLAQPADLAPAVRRIVRELDPGAATAEIRPMTAVVARSMARVSFTLTLLGIAGAMALVLSAVGLYGVLAYMVSRRTSEIGIRMALGARAEQVVRLVLGHSVRMVVAGIVIGVVIAAVALRALRAVLFGVEPLDPVTLGVAAAVLLGVGVLAAWLPARRATRVSPVAALQSE